MSIFLSFLRRFFLAGERRTLSSSLSRSFFLTAIACRHFSTREESAYYDYYSLPVSCWLSGTFSHWSMVRKSIQTEKQSFSCLVLVDVFFVFLSTLSKRWTWTRRMRWRGRFSLFLLLHRSFTIKFNLDDDKRDEDVEVMTRREYDSYPSNRLEDVEGGRLVRSMDWLQSHIFLLSVNTARKAISAVFVDQSASTVYLSICLSSVCSTFRYCVVDSALKDIWSMLVLHLEFAWNNSRRENVHTYAQAKVGSCVMELQEHRECGAFLFG